MKLAYSGPPKTARQVCLHELAHAFSACLSLYRIAPKHYGKLLLHINAEQYVATTFDESVPIHIQRKVRAMSALGPIALMPQDEIAETLRRSAYEKADVLSNGDLSVLYDVSTSKQERDTSILAALAHFSIHEEKLAEVADELSGVIKLDILAPILVPREMAHRANAAALMLMLDQKLGQSYKGTLQNARNKAA